MIRPQCLLAGKYQYRLAHFKIIRLLLLLMLAAMKYILQDHFIVDVAKHKLVIQVNMNLYVVQ